MSEINNQKYPAIGYTMFNNDSLIRTDKRNKNDDINNNDFNNNNDFENLIYFNNDYIPKTSQRRKIDLSKGLYHSNNNNYHSVLKWKCMNCGNINLLYNKICINCKENENKFFYLLKQQYNYHLLLKIVLLLLT